jgi:serine/threonine-protein kinase HipA
MVDVAEVKIWGELAGAVRWDDIKKLGIFEYDSKFIEKAWDLSPIKMPIKNGSRIYSFPELRIGRREKEVTFKGLPGFFADSLPDKYGNRLINTWLVSQGRQEDSMNPLEKLCFIGSRGMGALEFEPAKLDKIKRSNSLEINSLVEIAKKILNERESFLTNISSQDEKGMMEILKIGTSAGGARPKALIAYNPISKEVKSGQGDVLKGFEHWLIKLDSVSNVQFGNSNGWGRVEYAYY